MLQRLFTRLPPLWAVAALFVGLTLPQALLGLPVAAAAVGPLPALAVLVAVGALMTVAAAAEAEALVRDGEFRRQGGYFGRLVERYLGRAATVIPNGLAGLRTSMSVLGAYIGLSVTLASLTGVSRVLWGALALRRWRCCCCVAGCGSGRRWGRRWASRRCRCWRRWR